jgi:hypothetical protein
MLRLNVSTTFTTIAAAAASAAAQVQGPSTGQTPYLLPLGYAAGQGATTVSIATNGPGTDGVNADLFTRLNTGATDYRLVGIPDGMGAFRTPADVANNTFTLLMNHELGANSGIVRDHGSRGAFVSQWTIRADGNNLVVSGAKDLIQETNLWNIAAGTYNTFSSASPMPLYSQGAAFGTQGWNTTNPNRDGLGRLCSADLAAPSAYLFNGIGTTERIMLGGEEIGASGRAFGHVATGPNVGKTYELPRLGDFSWENALSSPFAQQKTVVVSTDDSTPGQVYVYVGNKQSTGNEIERAGLNNGSLYGVKVTGVAAESRDFGLATSGPGVTMSAPFTMVNNGDVSNEAGSTLDANDRAAGVTDFLRPEDGVWDPRPGHENDFYFVTTDRFNNSATTGGQIGRSRLWRMRFNDIANPENGGQLEILMAGHEGHQMMDNMTMDGLGRIVMQEDPGNNQYAARVWVYETDSGAFGPVAEFDRLRFGGQFPFTNAVAPFSQDEESSGIIDAADILGQGWFLFDVQAHYSIGGELVEGGQLGAIFIPPNIMLVPEPATAMSFIVAAAAAAGASRIRRRR